MPFTLPKCHENLLESTNLGFLPFEITRLSLHVMVMGLFASLIGPFGGFFASGLKRSIKIKVKNIVIIEKIRRQLGRIETIHFYRDNTISFSL